VNVVVLHLPAWFAKVWWISSSRASIVACGIQVSAQSNVVHVAQKVALSDVGVASQASYCTVNVVASTIESACFALKFESIILKF